jgi:hypothetical protein
MSISRLYLCDTLRLIAVCPNYYLFPFAHPSPPAAIVPVAISIDVVYEQVGMKGKQVKYAKQFISVVKIIK